MDFSNKKTQIANIKEDSRKHVQIFKIKKLNKKLKYQAPKFLVEDKTSYLSKKVYASKAFTCMKHILKELDELNREDEIINDLSDESGIADQNKEEIQSPEIDEAFDNEENYFSEVYEDL